MKVKKCPFCNMTNSIYLANRKYTGWTDYWIECSYCGARGPLTTSEQDALKAWNNIKLKL